MNVYEKLMQVQCKLKAPKNQFNSFGKYHYRSCEDILEGLKPMLLDVKATVILTDQIKQIGDRYYLEATATFIDIESGEKVSVNSLAREDETKKGMDLAQVTGSVSSYARKYALNGLFCIDDNKDSDYVNTNQSSKSDENKIQNGISEAQIKRLYAIAYGKGISKEKVKEQVLKQLNKEVSKLTKQEYDIVCSGYEKL
ncbi:ERF superfamily [uncultured Clostridium sp.]|nr:ERF superfamily [uncultured Clostridium sp.]SCI96001.1 ERF superfamily [uncultured Clostridium sp.]